MPEEKPKCPRCHSGLIVALANQQHCNSCSFEFAMVRDPIAQRAQSRKDARSPATGWHKHRRDG
jgi:hypothetical protein